MRIKFNDKIYRLKEIESGVDSLMELVEEPKYKHGDFLMTRNRLAFIFDREGENGEAHHLFCTDMGGSIKDNAQDRWRWIRHCGYLKDVVVADQKATEAIVKGLKLMGKRWNDEKKCVEDIQKRKFNVGDKVRIKDGISSDTHGLITEDMDKLIGERLIVIGYNSMSVLCSSEVEGFCHNYLEDWLEPWIDEPKIGDWVIAWDNRNTPIIGVLDKINKDDSIYPYQVGGINWNHAVKWDGTVDHLEKIRSGKV